MDFDKARETRLAMVERIQREDMLVAAGHFPTGAHFGRIVTSEGRRYWQIAQP